MAILDSQGRQVKITSSVVRSNFDNRGIGLSSSVQAPGKTLMSRFAGTASKDLAKFKRLAADVETSNPAIRSPLLNQSNFFLPESDSSTGEPNRLLNQWITYYAKWHPLVGNLLQLHSTTEKTLILTNNGLKSIKDVLSSDLVLSSNGTWQPCYWSESHDFTGLICKLKVNGFPEEEYTYNHPILIKKSVRVFTRVKKDSSRMEPIGEPMWVPAERVLVGDYVLFPKFKEVKAFPNINLVDYIERYKNRKNATILEIGSSNGLPIIINKMGPKAGCFVYSDIPINEDLAEILGWYVSEGHVAGNIISFALHATKDPIDKIRGLLRKVFNLNPAVSKNHENGAVVTCSSQAVGNFLKETCGNSSTTKRIPEFIYMNTSAIFGSFVRAYIAGDGCFRSFDTTKKDVQCCTVSKTLAYQLRTYCTKLGFLWNVRRGTTKRVYSHKPIKQSELWTLTACPQNILPALYNTACKSYRLPDVRQDTDYFYIPIKKVIPYAYKGMVYDIKTSDHSFTTGFIVHNSELPLSRFALRGIEDKKILDFYENMVESSELHVKMVEMLRQYFTYGEVIPYAFWSDTYNCFTDLTFLDSNYVYVKGHYLLHSDDGDDVEYYELEPDPLLINLVKSDDYVNKMLRGYLGEDIVSAVRQNKRLLLSNFSTYMIKNRLRWADLRGTAIVLRCLKSLLWGDKLMESSYVVADGHVNPKWIWKIGQAGDLSTGGYMPSEEDLQAFRDLLVESSNDPLFTIITHYAVNVDAVGLNGKLLPLGPEYQKIENDILTALFANKAITTGEGPNYSTASIAFRALMSRYIPIRARVERYLYQKIFAPVAYANKFYTRKKADLAHNVRTGDEESNKLCIPQIDWRSKANLMDDGSAKSIISSAVASGRLPMKILCDAMDLDYTEVRNYLYSEQGTVFDPITQNARKVITSKVTDQTMMGQPFIPKTNQPVSMKSGTGKMAQPSTKKAASKLDDKRKRLLSVKPLFPKDPIQTQIDKGKPEKGGNPTPVDPMKESVKIEPIKATAETTVAVIEDTARIFDTMDGSQNNKYTKNALIKKNFDKRKIPLKNALIDKKEEKKPDA